jgi:hypothetical protein
VRRIRTALAATTAAGLAATAFGLVGTAQATETTPGAAGLGDRLFPGLGNGGYDAQAYDVSFDFQVGVTTMAASVTMRATATQALSRFNLDSVGQQIAAVTVNGRRARFSTSGEELTITPASPLARAGRSRPPSPTPPTAAGTSPPRRFPTSMSSRSATGSTRRTGSV